MADSNNKPHDKKDEHKTEGSALGASSNQPKSTSPTKNNINDLAKKTGELAGKTFAMAKAATKDIAQELKNVNEIRKVAVSSAKEGTTKKDLAKGFWSRLSGKQKILIALIAISLLYLLYLALREEDNFLIGVCKVQPASANQYKCDPKLIQESQEFLVSITRYKKNDIEIDLLKGKRNTQPLNFKALSFPATYKIIEKNKIQVTYVPKGCLITLHFTKVGKEIYEETISGTGTCDRSQTAAIRDEIKEGKRKIAFSKKI